jgi:GAF domain-containing protein
MDGYQAFSEELERAVGELTRLLYAPGTLDAAMKRTADLAVAAIPTCDTCSVSLVADGKITACVSTDEVAERLDGYQYENDSGPCLDAIRNDELIGIASLAEETRWPAFVTSAAGVGLESSYSVPLRVDHHTVGALNLYSLGGRFEARDEAMSQAFAQHAAVTLANAEAYQHAQDLVENLRAALESRDIIGQAKGIIMERERCTADAAFEVLRSVSQQRNIKLRELAQLVVDTGTWTDLGPSDWPGPQKASS